MIAPGQGKPKRPLYRVVLAVLGWTLLATVVLAISAVALILWMLSRPAPIPPAKVDVGALKALVNLDVPIKAAKWEVFRSPDDGGFMPSQDPYTVLIAELTPSDPAWAPELKALSSGRDDVMPDSARTWISEPFQSLMKNATNKDGPLAAFGCGELVASMTRSGRAVEGYVCPHSGKVLIYLVIDSPP